MPITLTGVGAANARIRRIKGVTDDIVREELEYFGERVQTKAKVNHNYNSQSGNLTRSIKRQYSFSGARSGHSMTVFLDARLTTITEGEHAGESYGVYQHEGTNPEDGGGIPRDRFLNRAWKSELRRLRRRLRQVPSRVRRMI